MIARRLLGTMIVIGLVHALLAPGAGCADTSPQCVGSPTNCVDFSSDDCGSQIGCWVDDAGDCTGYPAFDSCDGLPDSVCTTVAGCSWTGPQ
jgi:hypothetical protein